MYGESVMARLRVRELAERRGLKISDVARESKLNIALVRRYWYNTASGTPDGEALNEVRLSALDKLAALLEVKPGDLIAE